MKGTPDVGKLAILSAALRDFRPFIGCRCCVAGGAVRDLLSGYSLNDIDIFVLGKPLIGKLDEMYPRLPDNGGPYQSLFCRSYQWPGPMGAITVQVIQKLGLTSVPKLLDSFDWTCCLWALTDCGRLVRHDRAELVGPGKVLRIHNPHTPEVSLERGQRFARRYEMQIDPDSQSILADGIQRVEEAREIVRQRAARRAA
jgi:hypothetical protein